MSGCYQALHHLLKALHHLLKAEVFGVNRHGAPTTLRSSTCSCSSVLETHDTWRYAPVLSYLRLSFVLITDFHKHGLSEPLSQRAEVQVGTHSLVH